LVLGISKCLSIIGVVGPAAHGIVVFNNHVVMGKESRVLIDRHDVAAAASLGVVSGARVVALLLGELGAVDRLAAEADAVVLEAGVSVTVALANGNTRLDSHVLHVGVAAEAEGSRVSRVGVASRVNKRLELGDTRGQLNSPCQRLAGKGNGCHSGNLEPQGGHDEKCLLNSNSW